MFDLSGTILKPYEGYAIEKSWVVNTKTGERVPDSTAYCAYPLDESGEADGTSVVDCAESLAELKKKLRARKKGRNRNGK